MADQTCPYCNGAGGFEAFVNRGPDIRTHSHEWMRCETCVGTGKINEGRAELIALGKTWRDARVARGETLMEMSKRIGVGPAEISQREHGRGQRFQFDAFAKLIG